jgi:hypothetical protein
MGGAFSVITRIPPNTCNMPQTLQKLSAECCTVTYEVLRKKRSKATTVTNRQQGSANLDFFEGTTKFIHRVRLLDYTSPLKGLCELNYGVSPFTFGHKLQRNQWQLPVPLSDDSIYVSVLQVSFRSFSEVFHGAGSMQWIFPFTTGN